MVGFVRGIRRICSSLHMRPQGHSAPRTIESLEPRRLMSITATGVAVSGLEGGKIAPVVATFTSSDPAPQNARNYTATIDWGDGQQTAGKVKLVGSSFQVTGLHAYREDDSFTVQVTIHDHVDGTIVATTAASTIADAPLTGAPLRVPPVRAGHSFTVKLAKVRDTDPHSFTGDLYATVDWGDGTMEGTPIVFAARKWTVSGTHTYASPGTYTVLVHPFDVGKAALDFTIAIVAR